MLGNLELFHANTYLCLAEHLVLPVSIVSFYGNQLIEKGIWIGPDLE